MSEDNNIPMPCLVPCNDCGMLVLVRLWHMSARGSAGHWEELAPPRTPALGAPHHCEKALQHKSSLPKEAS